MNKIYVVLISCKEIPDVILRAFNNKENAEVFSQQKNSDMISYDPESRQYTYVSGPHILE